MTAAMRKRVSGGYIGGVTPVPIPNTEVKPSRADGTPRETAWESRSLPDILKQTTGGAREASPVFFGCHLLSVRSRSGATSHEHLEAPGVAAERDPGRKVQVFGEDRHVEPRGENDILPVPLLEQRGVISTKRVRRFATVAAATTVGSQGNSPSASTKLSKSGLVNLDTLVKQLLITFIIVFIATSHWALILTSVRVTPKPNTLFGQVLTGAHY
jgi:hypothetical protein